MAAAKKANVPPQALAHYEKLVAAFPEVERKGAGVPYTSLNGNMFSYVQESGTLALRLAAEDREKFLEKHGAKLVEAYGIVQREYVAVPGALLAKTGEMKPWFARSLEYATTLKAKPGKKTPKEKTTPKAKKAGLR
jgi:hypothetical protein